MKTILNLLTSVFFIFISKCFVLATVRLASLIHHRNKEAYDTAHNKNCNEQWEENSWTIAMGWYFGRFGKFSVELAFGRCFDVAEVGDHLFVFGEKVRKIVLNYKMIARGVTFFEHTCVSSSESSNC